MVIFAYLDADAKGDEGWCAQQDQILHERIVLEKIGQSDQQKGAEKIDAQNDGGVLDALFQSAKVELEHDRFLLVIHSTGHACIYYTAFLCPNLTPTRKFFLPHINFVNIHKNTPQHLLNIVFFNLFKIPLDML